MNTELYFNNIQNELYTLNTILNYKIQTKHLENKGALEKTKTELVHLCRVIDSMVGTVKSQLEHFDLRDVHYRTAFLVLKGSDTRGVKSTIQFHKYLKRYVLVRALGSNDPIEKITRKVKVLPDGTPLAAEGLISLFVFGPIGKRIALTICNFFNVLYGPLDPSTSAIEDKFDLPIVEEEGFKEFISNCKILTDQSEKFVGRRYYRDGYRTLKGGPNGPSIVSYMKDLNYIVHREPEVLTALIDMYIIQGSDYLNSITHTLTAKYFESYDPEARGPKVTQIAERGGKTRNICISDFFTQNALKPIHDIVFEILKSFPNDGTHNQEAAFSRVVTQANKFGCAFSFDLTSATDRFPVSLQKEVIKLLFSDKVADLWYSLLVPRYYSFNGKKVKWGVGQPLGVLSSWAVFTLTHHLFVKWCAGSETFQDYEILGDDIVIFDPVVAMNYEDKLKLFGVSINRSKSFACVGGIVYGEFCKRVFQGKTELSPFPIKKILKADDLDKMYADLSLDLLKSLGTTDPVLLRCFVVSLPVSVTRKVSILLSVVSRGLISADHSGYLDLLNVKTDILRTMVAASIVEAGQRGFDEKIYLMYRKDTVLDETKRGFERKVYPKMTHVPVSFGYRNIGRFMYLHYGGMLWTRSDSEFALFGSMYSPFRDFVDRFTQKVFNLREKLEFFAPPITDRDLEDVLDEDWSTDFPSTEKLSKNSESVLTKCLRKLLFSGNISFRTTYYGILPGKFCS